MNNIILVLSLLLMNNDKPDDQRLNLTRSEKIEYIGQAAKIDPEIIKAIMLVESEGNIKAVGDGHKQHKAYGLFQLRQPAVNEVNRKYGMSRTMTEIRESEELQIAYAALYLQYLIDTLDSEDAGITAYNVGLTGYRKGRRGNYLKKVKEAMND